MDDAVWKGWGVTHEGREIEVTGTKAEVEEALSDCPIKVIPIAYAIPYPVVSEALAEMARENQEDLDKLTAEIVARGHIILP